MARPWDLGPRVQDFSGLANLGSQFTGAYDAARKRVREEDDQALFATAAQGGNLNKLGMAFLARGRVQEGAALLSLGQKAAEGANDKAVLQSIFGGGGASAPAAAPIGAVSNAPASPRGIAVAETPEQTAQFEAQAAGLTQLGNRNEPRGLRNNNPGNIESGKFAATVQGFQGSDGRFAQYANPEDGIKAADKLLVSYAGRGLNTVAGIVNRWAPPTENNTGAYAASVARELGVDPNAPLDMNNWETRQKLIAAKIRVENGKQPYSEDVFQRALNPDWKTQVAQFEGAGPQATQTAQAPAFIANQPPQAGQFNQPAQVAQAPAPQVPGDDPVRLRQEAEYYARSNPEAARQLSARADAAEQARGVQTAQADMPAQGATFAQGFAIPGTGQVIDRQTYASNPRVRQMVAALGAVKSEQARAAISKQLEIELADIKEAREREARGVDVELKREQLAKARRENAGEVANREDAAARAGLRTDDPRYSAYLLTGKMPREDMGPLSATDKKAIMEADEAVVTNQGVIDNLRQAKELSAKAYAGPLAGVRGQITGLAGSEAGQATTEYNNLVAANALASLKAIFGGAPTEGERKILLEIQGSASLPHQLRTKILDRGIAMAERRLTMNQQRAKELRGGDFYKPENKRGQGGQQPDLSQARQGTDGNYYVPDPSRPGKFLMVQP